jgi:hypothetical protein
LSFSSPMAFGSFVVTSNFKRFTKRRALSDRRQCQGGAELLAQSEFVDLLPVLGQFPSAIR